jgi:3-deoxy-D-manno-octulosonic-acid transferase
VKHYVRSLYTLIFYLIQPLVVARLLWRSLKAPAYRERMAERYGFYRGRPPSSRQCIWVHAVSVGETIASVPLIKQLAARYPQLDLVVTTTTPTGAERVQALLGDSVTHVYVPYDLPGALRRFLRQFQPQMLVIIETELWPNMIHYCRRSGVPVMLANGRLSAKSAAGYARVAGLSRPMLQQLSAAAVQTSVEAQRFIELGLPAERAVVTGNMKFDMSLGDADRDKAQIWRQLWAAGRSVWIAASTHEGEDAVILTAHAALVRQFPDLLLILVPRHPERFTEVAQHCQRAGFTCHQLSAGAQLPAGTSVLVGDTMGDLLGLYGAADIAFVGGSLVPRGGHNLLEPALWALPVLAGPHLFNFQQITELLEQAGGLLPTPDAKSLERVIAGLLGDTDERKKLGQQAYAVVAQNRGALQRLVAVIQGLLPPAATG